jgi:hypothetical protein
MYTILSMFVITAEYSKHSNNSQLWKCSTDDMQQESYHWQKNYSSAKPENALGLLYSELVSAAALCMLLTCLT